MTILAAGATNGAALYVPLAVIGIALLAIAIGLVLFAKTGSPYEQIGGGIFDRPSGDDGNRPAPDADYEEFGEALAESCAREERSKERLRAFPPSPSTSS